VASSGGCLYLISGGAEGAGPSYLADMSKEGEDIFLFTSQRLVAQDRDELTDIYDARVGGGIAAQEAIPAAPCEGEAGCLPAAASPPAATTPQSPGATGANVVPPGRCAKGKVRRHGRCVRRPAKHKKHHARHHRHKKHGKAGGRGHGKKGKGAHHQKGKSGKGAGR
jgi:hypothetical protein